MRNLLHKVVIGNDDILNHGGVIDLNCRAAVVVIDVRTHRGIPRGTFNRISV